jgi:hypothetical protein
LQSEIVLFIRGELDMSRRANELSLQLS